MQVSLPTLLDAQPLYQPYSQQPGGYAPFPVQVVVDQNGIVQYVAHQYDAEAVRAVIDDILGK